MKKRVLVILLHCFAWFVFLSMPYIFKPDHTEPAATEFTIEGSYPTHQLSHDRENGVVHDILMPPRLANGVLFIIIFYSNYLFVLPRFFGGRRYSVLVASLIASIGLFFLVNFLIGPSEHHHSNAAFTLVGPSHNLFMFIIVLSSSFMLSAYRHMRKTEEARLRDEILFLKAQINPHFLFNTLNSIYSLSLTRSDKTPDAIVKLSSLFRYCVTDAGKEHVPLQNELQYISDYIGLQQLRLTEKVELKYTLSGAADDYEIIPFVLIPFVENAFRHGVNPEENSRILIDIAIEAGILKMSVKNSKVHVEENDSQNSGFGIENTIKRLRYHYPEKHSLELEDKDQHFQVRLRINLIP